jgi:hypothetical protein
MLLDRRLAGSVDGRDRSGCRDGFAGTASLPSSPMLLVRVDNLPDPFALKSPARKGFEWPLILMAVLSALFLALGVLRHYVDIWQHRSVRGISFLFVGIDAAGDLTSLLSLCASLRIRLEEVTEGLMLWRLGCFAVFEPKFDVLGCIIYSVELVLWIGIMTCGIYYHYWQNNNDDEGKVDTEAGVDEDVEVEVAGSSMCPPLFLSLFFETEALNADFLRACLHSTSEDAAVNPQSSQFVRRVRVSFVSCKPAFFHLSSSSLSGPLSSRFTDFCLNSRCFWCPADRAVPTPSSSKALFELVSSSSSCSFLQLL